MSSAAYIIGMTLFCVLQCPLITILYLLSSSPFFVPSTASSRQGLNLTEKGEPAGEENEKIFGYPGPPEASTIPECVMCHKRPKKATVIHGATGHYCCCMPCAQELYINGDRCPICLVPVENVVEVFDGEK